MNRFFKNPCNLYITLQAFYSMQGVMIPTGGTILSQAILMVTMLMGIYYMIQTFSMSGKPVYFKGLNLLFFTLSVYGILLLLSNHHYMVKAFGYVIPKSNYLKYLFLSFPNVYTFYYFARKGYLTESLLRKWVIVFFCIAIFRYFDYQMSALQQLALAGSDAEEVTNNMGYVFAALIPSLAIFRRNIRLQYGLLLVCIAFIVMGMKRGAVLVGAVSLLYFVYLSYKYNRFSRWKMLFFVLLIVVASIGIVQYMLDTSDYFVGRVMQTEEGGSSGRDAIYGFFWNHFVNERDTFKYLFGNGANATLEIGVNYAHNDWLEIAINQGVLGLLVYLFYWLCFLKTVRQAKCNRTAQMVLTLTFLTFFIKTMFSMSYTDYSMVSCCAFGYYLVHYRDTERT